MGNSSSKKIELLNKALKRRHDLADAHLKLNGYYKEVADSIDAFIKEQKRQPQNPRTQQYTVELPEDDDDENLNEGALNTRRQDIIVVPEARRLALTDVSCKEFLQALRDVEGKFRMANNIGKEVSKMLEAETSERNSTEIKSKSVQPPKLFRSLSRSSSRVHCSTFNISSERMGLTLEKLKDWEVKLYKDLKRKKQAMKKSDKSNASAGEEHDNIMVNPKVEVYEESAEFYSDQITKLRGEQLLPKLYEQLKGMRRNWKAMSELYKTQKKIMLEVEEYSTLSCEDEHVEATKALKKKLDNWWRCFASYISQQIAYFGVLYCWLSESKPPILEYLRETEVEAELKSFRNDVEALLVQQKNEHWHWHEVAKLQRRVESREERLKNNEVPEDEEQQINKEIDELKERIKEKRERYNRAKQDTQEKMKQFQTGFAELFEKLEEFSKKAEGIYNEFIEHLQSTPLASPR